MSFTGENSKRILIADGVATVFAYNFLCYASAHLGVYINGVLQVSGYTVDGLGVSSGGNVTFSVAPANLAVITLNLEVPYTQELDYPTTGKFPAASHEQGLDLITMLCKRLKEVDERALVVPQGGDADEDLALPSQTDRASKYLAFDAEGNPVATTGTTSVVPTTPFSLTLLDDANAADARTTLGVPTLAEAGVQADNVFRITGSSDATKKVAHEVDGLTTATTRTLFHTDEDVSIGQPWGVHNLTLVATVAANALTVALKTKGGSDATATNPILFKFRNAAIGTGDYTTVALTAALSLVISSGSTLGTVSATPHRLYVGIANDGGTLRLFLYNPLDSTLNLNSISDDSILSSTAEGGAGAADSAHVLYSGTAFTSKAVRVLGYFESTQATAGTWATTPSKIQLMGQGVRASGDRVQRRYTVTGAVATGTTVLPDDDTIPQITEGDEYMTLAITPRDAMNLLAIRVHAFVANSLVVYVSGALFQDSTANALATAMDVMGNNNYIVSHSIMKQMLAGTVSSTTFRFRAGGGSGTTTFNGFSGARKHGGALASYIEIEEIHV